MKMRFGARNSPGTSADSPYLKSRALSRPSATALKRTKATRTSTAKVSATSGSIVTRSPAPAGVCTSHHQAIDDFVALGRHACAGGCGHPRLPLLRCLLACSHGLFAFPQRHDE